MKSRLAIWVEAGFFEVSFASANFFNTKPTGSNDILAQYETSHMLYAVYANKYHAYLVLVQQVSPPTLRAYSCVQ